MTGWGNGPGFRAGYGSARWVDDPAWMYEITWEWKPLPGQRYPGDPGRRRNPGHIPVHQGNQRLTAPEEAPRRYSTGDSPADSPARTAPRGGRDAQSHSGVGRAVVAGPTEAGTPPQDTTPAQESALPRDATPPVRRAQPAWNRPALLPERLPSVRPEPLRPQQQPARPPGARPPFPSPQPDQPPAEQQPEDVRTEPFPSDGSRPERALPIAPRRPSATVPQDAATPPTDDLPEPDADAVDDQTDAGTLAEPEAEATYEGEGSWFASATDTHTGDGDGDGDGAERSGSDDADRDEANHPNGKLDDKQDADAAEPAVAVKQDPEQVLAAYPWRFHHDTLRELVDDPDELREIRDRLTAKLQGAYRDADRARLLSLRAVVSRILGDLGAALADGREALEFAEATGELRRTAIVQARLAHVLQWRGDFAEADRLFAEANSVELPDRLRATMHEHAGRCSYDQGRFIEACNHFERALDLRKVEDPDMIARTEVALDAVLARVVEKGWGPYPRSREEVLRLHRAPVPSFGDYDQRWGYADAYGVLTIPPRYAEAQPFHEGAAWVRRPAARNWELIDENGDVVIDSSSAYLGVGSFSDGLAWVSRDAAGGWFAIDRRNTVVIRGGFDDVRPFRRGFAAVRRGGWGAIDSKGRIVVPLRYRAFATALANGQYVDGFTDEGLAIVDAGDRKGVVDRTGRMIVTPAHFALVIHPVAFLIGDRSGRWGALDRRGEPLIEVEFASRGKVADELDRLLADTRPVL